MPTLVEQLVMAPIAVGVVLAIYAWGWRNGWHAALPEGEARGFDRGLDAGRLLREDRSISEHIARLKCAQRQRQGERE